MERHAVLAEMNRIREATAQWTEARKNFNADVDKMLDRLILEAAQHRFSVTDLAGALGLTPRATRALMRAKGINPKYSSLFLSHHASRTLQANAEILGVDPSEIDLLSPLAYLPAGSKLKAMRDE